MKCQNCGVNFDDSERECPMCGTRAGARGRMSVPWYTDETHKTHSKETCTHQTYTKTYSSKPAPVPVSADGKPRGGKSQGNKVAGVLLAVIVALGGLVPAAFEWVSDRVNGADAWIQDQAAFDGFSNLPEPDETPADDSVDNLLWANSVFGAGGVITLPDGGEFTLAVTEDDQYTLSRRDAWVYDEHGEVWCWWNDPEDDLYPQIEDYPAGEYESFTLCLEIDRMSQSGEIVEPDAVEAHADMGEMWLLAHVSTDTGEIVLHDWYGDGAFLFGGEQYLPLSAIQAG